MGRVVIDSLDFKWLEKVREGTKLISVDTGEETSIKYVTFDYGVAYEIGAGAVRIVEMDCITGGVNRVNLTKRKFDLVCSLK